MLIFDEMDITNANRSIKVIKNKYDAVVHCAAWTAVDKTEDGELMLVLKLMLWEQKYCERYVKIRYSINVFFY